MQFLLAQKINKPILKDCLLKWKKLTNESIRIKHEKGINRIKQDIHRLENGNKANLKKSHNTKTSPVPSFKKTHKTNSISHLEKTIH